MSNNLITLTLFPNTINDPLNKTSDKNKNYNCIAWSLGIDNKWYWPNQDAFWPINTMEETVDAFRELYYFHNFEECDNSKHETGYLKIALFVNANDIPTHASRQLENGNWTSKLGQDIDVEHTLDSISNGFYGNPKVFFKKKV